MSDAISNSDGSSYEILEISKASRHVIRVDFDSSGRDITYHPVHEGKKIDLLDWLTVTFLPVGYPKSVKSEYFEVNYDIYGCMY